MTLSLNLPRRPTPTPIRSENDAKCNSVLIVAQASLGARARTRSVVGTIVLTYLPTYLAKLL